MLKKAFIGIVIASLSFYLLLKNVDFDVLLEHLEKSLWHYFGLTIAYLSAQFFFRAVRLSLLVNSPEFRFAKAHSVMIISNFLNLILPLRLGEIAKMYLLSQWASIPLSLSVLLVFLERALDILVLGALTFLCVFILNVNINVSHIIVFVFLLTLVSLVAVIAFAKFKRLRVNLALWVKKIIFLRKFDLSQLVRGVFFAIKKLRLTYLIVLSCITWGLTVLHHAASLQAQSISNTYETALLVTVLNSISISLPSTPGFIGPYQASYLVAAKLLDTSPEQFTAASILSHIANYIYLIPLTIFVVWTTRIKLSRVMRKLG